MFLESGPYTVGAKHDSETRKLIYYVTRADPVPDRLSVIAGDAVQNLKSALDHQITPIPDERLKHVTLKVDRAKEHAADLEQELRVFLESGPYTVGAKHDSETRKLIYYVTELTLFLMSVIAGDAVQNLKSALDHLAYQIVCNDTGDNPPNPNWIYFPIADDAKKYEAKKTGKMEGAHRESFEAIDDLKPYRGGNDLLWMLYRLNNIEKHRLLLTVGSQAAGINLGQLMSGHLGDTFSAEPAAQFESMDVYLNPADKGFPLSPGFELYVGEVGEKPNPKQQFRFTVALQEPGIIEGEPLLDTEPESVYGPCRGHN